MSVFSARQTSSLVGSLIFQAINGQTEKTDTSNKNNQNI